MREDPTANLAAIEELLDAYPDTDIVLIESGGDNLTLTFSPLLADRSIYVLDVAGGDKTPRKQGPGLMNADLLVINKTTSRPTSAPTSRSWSATRSACAPARSCSPTAARRRHARGRRLGHRADGDAPGRRRCPPVGGLNCADVVTLRDEGSSGSSAIPPLLRHHVHARLEAHFTPSGARVVTESPLELRGPFYRDAARSYFLRNVTAGIFAGDAYRIDATAEAGSTVRIASSSATKVHAMPSGHASLEVNLLAEPGSTLVWGPHATILQSDSDLRQGLDVSLASGARVLLAEVLVLGRVARGERCAFRRFESELTVSDGCRMLYEERYVLTPGKPLSEALAGYGAVVSICMSWATGTRSCKGACGRSSPAPQRARA